MADSQEQLFDLIIVTPAFNEDEGLPLYINEIVKFTTTLQKTLLIIVNDGSTDNTEQIINQSVQKNQSAHLQIMGIHLSRNFGHQSALNAGISVALENCSAETLILLMDSDLEHPPKLIPSIYSKMRTERLDHLQMIRNDQNRKLSLFKKSTSKLYYYIFNLFSGYKLRAGSADFRCMTHIFAQNFSALPEVDRFNRGLFTWLGFHSADLTYEPEQRSAGTTKYNTIKMIMLGLTGLTAFSTRPLLLLSGSSLVLSLVFCFTYALYEIYKYFVLRVPFAIGYPTIIFFIFFWGGLVSFMLFVQAIYLSKTFIEVKSRPSFIIREKVQ